MTDEGKTVPWHVIAESGIEAVLGSSLLGVVTTDVDWNVTFANDEFCSLLACGESVPPGSALADVLGSDRFGRLVDAREEGTEGSAGDELDVKFDLDDGAGRRCMVRARSWPMRRDGARIGHVVVVIDISDRYDDVRRFQVADDLVGSFMSVVRDAVIVTDSDGVITDISSSVEPMFGWRREDLVGSGVELLMNPADDTRHSGWLTNYLSSGGAGVLGRWRTLAGRRRDGEVFPIELRVVESVVGSPPGFVAFIRDLGEVHDLNRRIERAQRTDDLTGLLTQSSFASALRSFVEDRGEPISLVKVDIARFHHVNNAYGYETGDKLLKAVAREIRAVVPDLPAGRVGGDRFAFVVRSSETDRVVRALKSRVEGRGRSRGISHPIRIDVGVARHESGTTEDLLKAASNALRVAKAGSSRTYVEYDHVIAEAIHREVALLADIHAAVKSRQLVTYFQPEIDLRTGDIIGHEALVRWNHPTRGLIPPDQFLPLAKAENLMSALGVQVLAASLDFVRKSADVGHAGRVWVNLSSDQLLDDSVVAYARSAVAGGLDPDTLGFELTEQDAFAVESAASDNLQALLDLGIAIAIDDFGTGYSSLTQLRSVEAEVVKLDRSFLMAIHTDEMQERFVGACIDLAHTLGRVVVAEGIETEDDAQLVARLGCDMAQGYWFGRPVPAAEALEALRAVG